MHRPGSRPGRSIPHCRDALSLLRKHINCIYILLEDFHNRSKESLAPWLKTNIIHDICISLTFREALFSETIPSPSPFALYPSPFPHLSPFSSPYFSPLSPIFLHYSHFYSSLHCVCARTHTRATDLFWQMSTVPSALNCCSSA